MAPTKTSNSNTSRRRRRHPLLEWYEKTTGNLIDKMCCCSYTEGQLYNEEDEPVTYDALKSGIVPPAWAQEVMDEMEPVEAVSPVKTPSKSKSSPSNHTGHLTLCGDDIFKPDLCLYEEHSPGGAHSVSTETTVSTSTLQTYEEGDSSGVFDGYEYRDGPPNLNARNSSRPRRMQRSGYRPDSHLEQSKGKARHSKSPVPIRPVNSGSLPNLPFLGITEGYEV